VIIGRYYFMVYSGELQECLEGSNISLSIHSSHSAPHHAYLAHQHTCHFKHPGLKLGRPPFSPSSPSLQNIYRLGSLASLSAFPFPFEPGPRGNSFAGYVRTGTLSKTFLTGLGILKKSFTAFVWRVKLVWL
jgi:hypothetical protein